MKERFRFLLIGLYAWATAVCLGGILLDMVYASRLKSVLGSSESALVFSGVSDTLLFICFIAVIAAAGAILSSWRLPVARSLLLASILLFLLELLIPASFPFMKIPQELSWVRLLPTGTASILAFAGLYECYRQK